MGLTGTCFPACLASIMEIGISTIPDLGDDDEFLFNVANFLLPFGLLYVQVHPSDEVLRAMFRIGQTYHTIEGISPNGIPHAVVGLNGKMIHDPDPRAPGLSRIQYFGILAQRSANAMAPIASASNARRYNGF